MQVKTPISVILKRTGIYTLLAIFFTAAFIGNIPKSVLAATTSPEVTFGVSPITYGFNAAASYNGTPKQPSITARGRNNDKIGKQTGNIPYGGGGRENTYVDIDNQLVLDGKLTANYTRGGNHTLAFSYIGTNVAYYDGTASHPAGQTSHVFEVDALIDVCDPTATLNGAAAAAGKTPDVRTVSNWFTDTLPSIVANNPFSILDNKELKQYVTDAIAVNDGTKSVNGVCAGAVVDTSPDQLTKQVDLTVDLPENAWKAIVDSGLAAKYPQWFDVTIVKDDGTGNGSGVEVGKQIIDIPKLIGNPNGQIKIIFQSDQIIVGKYDVWISGTYFPDKGFEKTSAIGIFTASFENCCHILDPPPKGTDYPNFFEFLKAKFPSNFDSKTPPADGQANGGTYGTNKDSAAATATSAIASGGDASAPTCERSGFTLSWILCPIINGLTSLSQGIFNSVIEPYLRTTPITTDNIPTNTTYKIWSNFRTIGNVLLVFGLLFIVFGQSIGGGMVDAYTAKKALPRILVAAILMNLSIYIVAIAVDIFNVLGSGIGVLITAPLRNVKAYNFSVGNSTAGTVTAVVGVAALFTFLILKVTKGSLFGKNGIGIGQTEKGFVVPGTEPAGTTPAGTQHSFLHFFLLFILLPIVIITISIFVTLIVRRGLILFLAIISPVALALFCLPQTEKYARKWLKTLMEALVVYPIVVALFAIAYVLSLTIISANGGFSDGVGSQLFAKLIGLVVLFIPLAMIPFAFKLAGGFLASAMATLTERGKKGHEAVKGNPNLATSRRNVVKARAAGGFARNASKYIHAAEGRGNAQHVSGLGRTYGRALGRFYNPDLAVARLNKKEADESEEISSTGDDTYRFAAGGFQASRDYNESDANGVMIGSNLDGSHGIKQGQYYNIKGKEIHKRLFDNAKRWQGRTANEVGTQVEYGIRKSKTDEHNAMIRIATAENARAMGWNQGTLDGTWAQAAYPHKAAGSHLWFGKPEIMPDRSVKWHDVGDDDDKGNTAFDDMSTEHQKKMMSHQLSSIEDPTWRVYSKKQEQVETRISATRAAGQTPAQKDIDRLAHIYEIMDAATFEQQSMGGMDARNLNAAAAGGGGGGHGPSGSQINVSGASAASQPIIKRMKEKRIYDFEDTGDANGQRTLIDKSITDAANPNRVVGRSYTAGGNTEKSSIPKTT